jgi:hypothetical protein
MRDSFHRNSRQRGPNRRPGSSFGSANASARRRGDGNNGVANAKRQYERYLALAQAALLSGDAVEAQNCYQHAEHYYRVMSGEQT